MFASKYEQVIERLRLDIRNGRYGRHTSRLPSFRELAKEYNVSLVTMAKTMNHLHREEVVEIAGTRGAFVKEKVEARERTNDIAVIHKYIGDRAGAISIGALEKHAHEQGMGTVALRAEVSAQYLPKLYTNLNADGYLFMHSTLTVEAAETLRHAKIPFVSFNRLDHPGVAWVDYDNEGAFGGALDHLLAAGARRIAHLNVRNAFGDFNKRLGRVYREKLSAAGCYDPALSLEEDSKDDLRKEFGVSFLEEAGRRMAKRLLTLPILPDAAVVREFSCQALIDECARHGVDLPERCRLVTMVEDVQEPPERVSLLVAPFREKIRVGFGMLHELIQARDPEPVSRLLPIEIRLR